MYRLIALLLCLIAFGFIVPLCSLIRVQLWNIFTNTTSNERYSRFNAENGQERTISDTMVNRNNLVRNCYSMCCDEEIRPPLREPLI